MRGSDHDGISQHRKTFHILFQMFQSVSEHVGMNLSEGIGCCMVLTVWLRHGWGNNIEGFIVQGSDHDEIWVHTKRLLYYMGCIRMN